MTTMRQSSGTVINIQKFSVNDGPGIRTVVFLKGCPLRCSWCANPESQLAKTQVLWNVRKCQGCGHCVDICPAKAIAKVGGAIQIDHSLCTACGACVQECPAHALEIEGKRMTVQEVLDIVLQDLPFYEESGGGITLSGGELFAQPVFAKNILLCAKEEGLHTCGETTGYVQTDLFADLLPLFDVLLFDMKHWDAEAHKRQTGVTNALPLLNLATAIRAGKEVLPRIPVIPGFNDSLTDAAGLAGRLREVGAGRCQLLPFHQFGESKYSLLGKNYAYQDVPALHKEELEGYRQIFLKAGIDAFF